MDLTPYTASLREDLATAASAGDDQTRRTAAVLSAALEPAARLAIMNALSDLAAEVTASLEDRVVEVRLDGRDVRVVVTCTNPHDHGPDHRDVPPPPPAGEPAGDISRMTLRLVEELKGKAEQAAAAQGVSLNTFVSQAVQGALQGRGKGKGWAGTWGEGDRGHEKGAGGKSRVRGWVQG
jgi:hypothetical protein